MLINYFSPLAPVVTLLLGALILLGLPPRRPATVFWGPVIVGITGVVLLTTRLTLGVDDSGAGLQILSGWSFSAAQAGAALAVRLDLLSLLFIILISLILLAVILHRALVLWYETDHTAARIVSHQSQTAGWLILAAGAVLFFVAANGLTLSYALIVFDALLAFYWWKQHRLDFGMAGLFLAFITVTGLMLQSVQASLGQAIFLGAIWLRLALYPLWGWSCQRERHQPNYFLYLLFSIPAGLYLFFRTETAPAPALLFWLILGSMVTVGLWGALTTHRQRWLVSVAVVESLALLTIYPLDQQVATAWVMGLLLSVTALWYTPRLGRPDFSERAWLWPYLPAAGATLTLLGLPFTLLEAGRTLIYSTITNSTSGITTLLVILSEGLVWSGLVGFWREIWRANNKPRWEYSVAGVVVMVPFLLPGLGAFIFAVVTGRSLVADAGFWTATWWGVPGLATALLVGYFAPHLKSWLSEVVEAVVPAVDFNIANTLHWFETGFSRTGKVVLRIEAWLEGQHYLGWALLVAILGLIIFFLGT